MDWSSTVRDPNERLVFEALADHRWDVRTIGGIARSVGLSVNLVEATLLKYEGRLIRRSHLPNADGEQLFTLKGQSQVRELVDLLRTLASKSVR